VGLVGIPLSLQAVTFGTVGEQLYAGKYFINFGDGGSSEMKFPAVESFAHTYYYPGDYTISLDYFQNDDANNATPDASSQITVKIFPINVSISNVGDEKDFFVELSNNDTDYSADISNWVLVSAQKSFMIPRDTILQAKSKMIISSRITNFSVTDKDTLKLMTPEGDIVFDYSSDLVDNSTGAGHLPVAIKVSMSKTKNKDVAQADEIPMNTLAAASILGAANKTDTSDNSSNKIIYLVSFIFIGISAYLVYFIRRKMFATKSAVGGETLKQMEMILKFWTNKIIHLTPNPSPY